MSLPPLAVNIAGVAVLDVFPALANELALASVTLGTNKLMPSRADNDYIVLAIDM